jgi:ubiquinone/menaquinone biosynthesis C-methylase UbiE
MGLKMNYSTYISKQSRKPTGIFGRFVMSFFFEMGNVELNTLVYKALSVEKNDYALEIGFGPGTLIKKIAERLDNGIIEGIDLSKSMVAIAQKKNRKHINNGKVQIHLGEFDAVVFEDNCFDKIFSVNTIYFWKSPKTTISKICRILKPGGKVVIGFHDKRDMEKMSHIISKKGKQNTCYCVVGTK